MARVIDGVLGSRGRSRQPTRQLAPAAARLASARSIVPSSTSSESTSTASTEAPSIASSAMSSTVVLAQVRSIVVDLLELTGLDEIEALAAIPRPPI